MRFRRRAALVALTLVAGLIGPVAAHAGTTVGSFEMDGNFLDDPAGEPIDWSSPPPNVTSFTDATETGDDVFGEGSKWQEPGGWVCLTGSAPAKDDIRTGAVSFRMLGGKQYVAVRFERVGVNGDAHLDVEFNRSAVPNASCPQMPERTDGDLVIAFDTQQGGSTINLSAHRWTGDASTGTFVPLALGTLGTTWDGAVNIPDTMGLPDGAFGEAILNISDTIGEIACGYFVSAHLAARASASAAAALKDRTEAQPVDTGNCPESSVAKGVRNVSAGEASFVTATTAVPSDVIEYRLAYANDGSFDAHDVTITDAIPAGSTFVSCTGGCTVDAGTATWSLGSVAPGSGATMTLRTQLAATFSERPAIVSNVAIADSSEESPVASNTTTVTVDALAVPVLAKDVRNISVAGTFATRIDAVPADVVEYRLVASNTGTGPVVAATVSDELPAEATFLACSDGCAVAGDTISWDLGTLAAGASLTRTFQAQLATSFAQPSTTIVNVATLLSDGALVDSNAAQVVVTAAPGPHLHKHAVNATHGGSPSTAVAAGPGDTIRYTLTYHNDGAGPAQGVIVRDPLPGGMTLLGCAPACAVSGSTLEWSLGDVAPGVEAGVGFDVRLDTTFPQARTTIVNVGTATTSGAGSADSNLVEVIVDASARSSLAKAVRNVTRPSAFGATAAARPDEQVAYRLRYRNDGTGPAVGVTLTDPLPPRTSFVSCTGACTLEDGTVSWSLGEVGPGASSEVTFVVRLDAAFPAGTTTIANVASARSSTEPATSSPPALVLVTAAPSLTLGKVADVTSARRGDLITYTLAYGNTGSGSATQTVVSDELPANTGFVSCTDACAVSGSSVRWLLGDLAPGATGTLGLTVTVTAAGSCEVCNVAFISSPDDEGGRARASTRPCVAVSPATDAAGEASGRAFGFAGTFAGRTQTVEAQPTTDEGTPDEIAIVDVPGVVHGEGVAVSNARSVTAASAEDTALAAATDMDLTVGPIRVQARAVVARATSTAWGYGATSTRTGSIVSDLVVNGIPYGTVTEPLAIVVRDPLGKQIGRVDAIATDEQSLAEGPGGRFTTRIAVAGLRVVAGNVRATPADESSDATVAHAAASASFTNLGPCGPSPTVAGEALLLSTPRLEPGGAAPTWGRVSLPRTGGDESARVEATSAAGDVRGTTRTEGTLSPHRAGSTAQLHAASVSAGAVRIAGARATVASALLSSSGSVEIARLSVAGLDPCEPQADGVCRPEPNTVVLLDGSDLLVVLNEQVPGGSGGLRVNAVHVFAIGNGNPLEQRIGDETVIASVFSFQGFLIDPPG